MNVEEKVLQIRSLIMKVLSESEIGKSVSVADIAKRIDPIAWRQIMDDVRKEIVFLSEQGLLLITHNHQIITPKNAKGAIQYEFFSLFG